ncbi:monooxygenase FAD-binding protein [Cubamyces sp. BRFM 1775]|nr:monooxygenase FAD-binding protein [Cubamyces sp. BRFM 1775]
MSALTNHAKPAIAIIGGGPSGLVLLLTLLKRGANATLYERDTDKDARAHLGGMLDIIWESGQRALRENGLEEAFIANSRSGDGEETRICGKEGVPLYHCMDVIPKDGNLENTRPEIDRHVLRDLLLGAVPAGFVRWGHALVSARPLNDGQHNLTFSNGLVTITEVLVGADGANSRVRPLLSPATPLYHGITGAEVSLTPDVASAPENRDVSNAMGMGTCYARQDGKIFIAQRNTSGRIRAYLWHRATIDWALPEDPKEAQQVLLKIYQDWTPGYRKFVELGDEHAMYTRPLLHLPIGHRWPHKPGVTIVGDVAHLMSPFAGAGANLAMLDGLELGLVLADAVLGTFGYEEREKAIAAWEERMLSRAEKFATITARNLETFRLMNPTHGFMVILSKRI